MLRSGLYMLGITFAIALSALAGVAHAQTLPPGVLACAGQPDSLKRLVCYDNEVAKARGQSNAGSAPLAVPPSGANAQPTEHAVNSSSQTAAPDATAAAGSAPAAAQPPKHLTAKIVSVDPAPDAMIIRLDNGQTWEQVGEASADPNLHSGDTVKIDRTFGSYWISGTNNVVMKVQLKQ